MDSLPESLPLRTRVGLFLGAAALLLAAGAGLLISSPIPATTPVEAPAAETPAAAPVPAKKAETHPPRKRRRRAKRPARP